MLPHFRRPIHRLTMCAKTRLIQTRKRIVDACGSTIVNIVDLFVQLDPEWNETICVRIGELNQPRQTGKLNTRLPPTLYPRKDFRTCFDIRDDGLDDPNGRVDPTGGHASLLHFGCTTFTAAASWDRGVQTVSLNGGARLLFRYVMTEPAPPPAPPLPPLPPGPPPLWPGPLDVVERLNQRFRNGRPSADLASAGVLVHQFDTMDDPDPDGEFKPRTVLDAVSGLPPPSPGARPL